MNGRRRDRGALARGGLTLCKPARVTKGGAGPARKETP